MRRQAVEVVRSGSLLFLFTIFAIHFKSKYMRPSPSDYPPYFETYVSLVETGDIQVMLKNSLKTMDFFLQSVSFEKAAYAYAAGKWTVKEVLQHCIDSEKVFAYRAMCIARGEQQPLPGFDQDEYAANVDISKRSLESLKEEMLLARKSTVMLFEYMSDEYLSKKGIAGNNPITVLALGYILLGHWRHHEKLFREKYGIEP
ncbi:MAG: DinB family protein [Chitinophagaceae bacterium]|nr:DinB family protein [Chitinophagaceae bacterium]